MDFLCSAPRHINSALNHLSSQVAIAVDRYSASAKDWDTICCFLVFRDIREAPKDTNQLVRDHHVKGHPA